MIQNISKPWEMAVGSVTMVLRHSWAKVSRKLTQDIDTYPKELKYLLKILEKVFEHGL